MRRRGDWPLAHRLLPKRNTVAGTFLAWFLPLLVTGQIIVAGLSMVIEYRTVADDSREAKTASMVRLAELIGPALYHFEYEIIQRGLDAYVSDPAIEAVAVVDDYGAVVANAGVADRALEASDITVPVHFKNEHIDVVAGKIHVRLDHAATWATLFDHVGSHLFAIGVSMFMAAVVVVGLLRNLIDRPINRIRLSIEEFRHGRTAIVDWSRDDELGDLATTFNRMQEQIHSERSHLRVAHAKLGNLYHRTPALLQVLDDNGRILEVSDYWLQTTGYTGADVRNRPFVDLLTSASAATFRARRQAGSNLVNIPLELTKVDGSRMHVMLSEISDLGSANEAPTYLGVMTDVDPLKRAEAAIRRQASTDQLTGLLNRRAFIDEVKFQVETAPETSAALAFLDLDHFKRINDTHGHHVGDALLTEAGRRIAATIRPDDVAGRLGGDEFAVLLRIQETDQPGDTKAACDRLLKAVSAVYDIAGLRLHVSGSIGLATYPTDAADASALFRHADLAMYAAKHEGRNGVHGFVPALREQAETRQKVEEALHRALAEGGFFWAFQPIFDLCNGRVEGAEALLRLTTPELGPVPPSVFVPVAEEAGLIQRIWQANLPALFDERAHWLSEFGGDAPRLNCNISACQLHENTLHVLSDAVTRAPEVGRGIVLELTESLLVDPDASTVSLLNDFKKLGFELALDDFGTGYSSLSTLHRLPVDILKVDRSFIADLTDEELGTAVSTTIRGIVALARELGIKVVAEGIETPQQLRIVRDLGIKAAQGFLLGRPVASSDLRELLRIQLDPQTRRRTLLRPVPASDAPAAVCGISVDALEILADAEAR